MQSRYHYDLLGDLVTHLRERSPTLKRGDYFKVEYVGHNASERLLRFIVREAHRGGDGVYYFETKHWAEFDVEYEVAIMREYRWDMDNEDDAQKVGDTVAAQCLGHRQIYGHARDSCGESAHTASTLSVVTTAAGLPTLESSGRASSGA